MSPSPDVPLGPAELGALLAAVHAQVAVALWLSCGMLLSVGMLACCAFSWRRAALLLGILYSASLCFVHNGHAQLLGPLGCAVGLAGLVLRP
jgi:hypothetical protein